MATYTTRIPITVNAEPLSYRLVVQNNPTKTVYTENEALDLTGVKVVFEGYNSRGTQSSVDVTAQCTFSPANGTPLAYGTNNVTVSYTEGS